VTIKVCLPTAIDAPEVTAEKKVGLVLDETGADHQGCVAPMLDVVAGPAHRIHPQQSRDADLFLFFVLPDFVTV
jgi:hypothetical protein